MNPPNNRKACIYARVSSKEQEREGFSMPSQLKLLNDYAQKNGFRVEKEFVDVETAKESGRTKFGEMVRFLQENPSVKTILVEKTDRLYRNFRDYVIIDDLDLEIHLVKEGEVLSKDSRSHQKFIHGIKVLLAKNYIDNLSEETQKGMKEKAEQGAFPSRAPLGYLNVQDGDKRFIQPNPQMALLIQKLFEWYATGNYSLRQLIRLAHTEGLNYPKSGMQIHKSNIAKILHNPIYYGSFQWKGTLYSGRHEPLISKSLFDKVQEVFTYKEGHKTRFQKYAWAFQGLVSCGHCGCVLVGEKKKGKYVYYHCTGNKGRCGEPYVREEELARQFGDSLSAIHLDGDVLGWLKEALKDSHKDEKEYHQKAVEGLQESHKRLQDRLDALYVDKLDGKVNGETYERLSQKWRLEQDEVEKALGGHKVADRSYIDEGVQLLELAAKARSLYDGQPMFERRRLLNYLHSNSTWKDGKLSPIYRQPFDILAATNIAHQKEKPAKIASGGLSVIWLPEEDSNL